MQNLTQLPVENLDVVNDSTVPSSGDPKPSKSLGPAPKVSTKVISFAISPRHKTSESQFGISSSPSDPQYAYKIKTTAPKKFCVRPNQGMVSPGETIEVSVSFILEKVLLESQTKDFNFKLVAQSLMKDKFLVQTVALAQGEEYPSAAVARMMREALALEQQGQKKEADAMKAQADELQHEQWESFKSSKRVVDSKIGLTFVDAGRGAGATGDDGAKSLFLSARASSNASPSDVGGGGGGNSVLKGAPHGLGRSGSAATEDGMSADLVAENARLRQSIETQKEVLAHTQEALEALKSQLDVRSRRSIENMSDADIAKAKTGVAGTVYDKKDDALASRAFAPTAVQLLMALIILLVGIVCGRGFGA